MSLPVAHGLLGATVATLLLPQQPLRPRLKIVLVAAMLAICPDLDYVFYQGLSWGESWHRGFSHSLLFAVTAGMLAGFLVKPVNTRSFVIYSMATFSHPFLDAVISEHPSGVQFLWPLSDRMFGFDWGSYYHTVLGGRLPWGELVWRMLAISSVEVLLFGPILLAAIWMSGRNRGYPEGKSPSVNTTRR